MYGVLAQVGEGVGITPSYTSPSRLPLHTTNKELQPQETAFQPAVHKKHYCDNDLTTSSSPVDPIQTLPRASTCPPLIDSLDMICLHMYMERCPVRLSNRIEYRPPMIFCYKSCLLSIKLWSSKQAGCPMMEGGEWMNDEVVGSRLR